MVVSYIRVSSDTQNLSMQRASVLPYNPERIFEEKISGKNMERPKLKEMLNFVREGDEIVIYSLSRISRSLKDLLEILDILIEKKVTLTSVKENITISDNDKTTRFFVSILGCVSELERENIRERQADGIKEAKKRGVYKGRKPIEIKDFDTHYQEYMCRKISKGKLAKKLGISRPTLNKLFIEYEEQVKGTCNPLESEAHNAVLPQQE